MQSSFHKRAAMAILRRELANQRLPGTAVRVCFPATAMAKVKKYTWLGMDLKSAGKISKFQVINRKGQPILQTGAKNQHYSDYQGDADEEEPTDNNSQWTLVESRRKRPLPGNTLTSPNSRPLTADRPLNTQRAPTAATWAALTEQEFPELVSQPKPQTPRQVQSADDKQNQPPAAEARNQPVSTTQKRKADHQPKPSGEPAEASRGSQPGSYPVSRASSRQNSRPSTPPPIRSIFDEDCSDNVRINMKPKPQRQPKPRAAQHHEHLRKGY
jgi:membrane peptidoglycan carboxypeptidase